MEINVDNCKQEIPSLTEMFVGNNISSNTFLLHFVGNTCWDKMLLLLLLSVSKETDCSNHQTVVSTFDGQGRIKMGKNFNKLKLIKCPENVARSMQRY
jgi:hypothetical protein